MVEEKIEYDMKIDKIKNEEENLYFDRKSARISSQSLANEIASFANANGGVVAVGVTDKGVIEGFNHYGTKKLNELQKVVSKYLKPAPIYKCEMVDVKNEKGEDDCILIFRIEISKDYIVRNNKDEVYFRQGDSSIKLTSDQVKSLEYERRERDFESEVLVNTSINDVDRDMVSLWKEKLETKLSDAEVLKARGFLVEHEGNLCLTKAGMLLFGKNPTIYFPGARLRVLKFEGVEFQIGAEMNIVKDKTFDSCLYKSIEEASNFIKSQLREFTSLNSNGIFETVPEYPEFAWYEGIVNAVIHRDYTNMGNHTTIKLFDDRLEICSPGKLGGFVTLDNMMTNRYCRNPQIARVLTELGIVRELNEGIKRIYSSMKEFFLEDPVFSEPNNTSVLLVLYNNIIMRSKRKQNSLLKSENIKKVWNKLNYVERQVLITIFAKGEITSEEVAKLINRGKTTAVKMLNKLISMELIEWTGTSKRDSYGKYIIK